MERARALTAETGPGTLLRQWRTRRRLAQELRIEAFFPADEATEAATRRLPG